MFNIAINTFKEIVRNKFLYLIVVFALIFILFSVVLGTLSIGEENRIIVDFGIAMIEIFGIIGVIFVGSQLLFKEIEGKTIFLVLSKPIERYKFILGKFFGFLFIITFIVFIQSILYFGVLFYSSIEITKIIIMSLVFVWSKLIILISLVLFFSTFMSNIITIVTSIMVYFVGHMFSLFLDMIEKMKIELFLYISKGLQLLFPPFEALNTKDYIGSMVTFSNNYYLYNSLYSLFYIIIILFFTILIFNRKKFEE